MTVDPSQKTNFVSIATVHPSGRTNCACKGTVHPSRKTNCRCNGTVHPCTNDGLQLRQVGLSEETDSRAVSRRGGAFLATKRASRRVEGHGSATTCKGETTMSMILEVAIGVSLLYLSLARSSSRATQELLAKQAEQAKGRLWPPALPGMPK
jgi:hypothetical protein